MGQERGCLGCGGLLALLFVYYIAGLQWKFYQRNQHNKAFLAECEQVADGLDIYAKRHQGHYPKAPEEVPAAIAPLLTGHTWPTSPWVHGNPETLPVLPVGLREGFWRGGRGPLPDADATVKMPPAALVGGGIMLDLSSRVGSLLYSVRKDRRGYVLYGVGGGGTSDSPDGGVVLPEVIWLRDHRRP
jgi:hypothetical protein